MVRSALIRVNGAVTTLYIALAFVFAAASMVFAFPSGTGATAAAQSITASASPLVNVVSVSAGGNHTCALIEDGTVKCWGYNNSGQLGDGTTLDHPHPVGVYG